MDFLVLTGLIYAGAKGWSLWWIVAGIPFMAFDSWIRWSIKPGLPDENGKLRPITTRDFALGIGWSTFVMPVVCYYVGALMTPLLDKI